MCINRTIVVPVLSLLFFLFVFVSHAEAHFLIRDNDIGATIHIDPEDNPYVGVPATFYIEIKDKSNKLIQEACICLLTISREGEILNEWMLFQNGGGDLSTPLFRFTFPERGIYRITLSGSPIGAANFQPFSMDYDIRVSREKNVSATNDGKGKIPILMSGFTMFIIGTIVYMVKVKRDKLRNL